MNIKQSHLEQENLYVKALVGDGRLSSASTTVKQRPF